VEECRLALEEERFAKDKKAKLYVRKARILVKLIIRS
jgi:hypothetical protein